MQVLTANGKPYFEMFKRVHLLLLQNKKGDSVSRFCCKQRLGGAAPLLITFIEFLVLRHALRVGYQGAFDAARHVFLRGGNIGIFSGGNGGKDGSTQRAALV